MVKEPKKLRRNYFKSGYIYVDVLSILPTDLAYFFLTTECFEMVPCPVIVRINRVRGHSNKEGGVGWGVGESTTVLKDFFALRNSGSKELYSLLVKYWFILGSQNDDLFWLPGQK